MCRCASHSWFAPVPWGWGKGGRTWSVFDKYGMRFHLQTRETLDFWLGGLLEDWDSRFLLGESSAEIAARTAMLGLWLALASWALRGKRSTALDKWRGHVSSPSFPSDSLIFLRGAFLYLRSFHLSDPQRGVTARSVRSCRGGFMFTVYEAKHCSFNAGKCYCAWAPSSVSMLASLLLLTV